MKNKARKNLTVGIIFILLFVLWTILVLTFDVKPVGINSTDVGFSALNTFFHSLTGVNMTLYIITDWAGLVPIGVCMIFALSGLCQLIKRKSIIKVDRDIIILGVYYIIVIACYLIFEMIPVNYRPVLINGYAEVSYPSSTTLLVLSVMPTLNFQASQRIVRVKIRKTIIILSDIFTFLMVTGRLLSGVHWLSDITGSVFLSTGMFLCYKSAVLFTLKKEE